MKLVTPNRTIPTSDPQATKNQSHAMPTSENLEFWSSWADCLSAWAAGLGVLAAVVAFIALGFSKRSGELKDEYSKAKSAEAEAGIASANKAAAEANERAEVARLEQERLKTLVTWRKIPPEKEDEIIRILSQRKGAVLIEYVSSDPDSVTLALQMARVLKKADWKIASRGVILTQGILWGVFIEDSTSTGGSGDLARKAFSLAIPNLATTRPQFSELGVSMGSPIAPPDAIRILVGVKSPADFGVESIINSN